MASFLKSVNSHRANSISQKKTYKLHINTGKFIITNKKIVTGTIFRAYFLKKDLNKKKRLLNLGVNFDTSCKLVQSCTRNFKCVFQLLAAIFKFINRTSEEIYYIVFFINTQKYQQKRWKKDLKISRATLHCTGQQINYKNIQYFCL